MLEENKSNWIISVKSSLLLIKRRKTLLMPISSTGTSDSFMLLQGLIWHHFSDIILRGDLEETSEENLKIWLTPRGVIHCLHENTNKSIHDTACFRHDPCNTSIENQLQIQLLSGVIKSPLRQDRHCHTWITASV